MNPSMVAKNRTARLVAEARMPVYSTDSNSNRAMARLLADADNAACGEGDFCHVCGRPTDHWGEHSPEQLLAWARTPLGRRLMKGGE